MNPTPHRCPPRWAIWLAFTLIYLSWGTTYLAIREGVHTQRLPPALFAGVRVALAGLILLTYLPVRGQPLRMPRPGFAWVFLAGIIMFIGGNGLMTAAEKTVPSNVAAVIAATTPLWIGLMESVWAQGDRLTARGWIGLVLGLTGVAVGFSPQIRTPAVFLEDAGPLMILGSACSWSVGMLLVRHRQRPGSHLAAAAYQMLCGGGALAFLGVLLGEVHELTLDKFTAGAAFSFFYLLIVGSLVGFVAFNWLIGRVPAAQVGTHAYVNPVVAIVVGWLLGGEQPTGRVVGGAAIILAGVTLVRTTSPPSVPLELSAHPAGGRED